MFRVSDDRRHPETITSEWKCAKFSVLLMPSNTRTVFICGRFVLVHKCSPRMFIVSGCQCGLSQRSTVVNRSSKRSKASSERPSTSRSRFGKFREFPLHVLSCPGVSGKPNVWCTEMQRTTPNETKRPVSQSRVISRFRIETHAATMRFYDSDNTPSN